VYFLDAQHGWAAAARRRFSKPATAETIGLNFRPQPNPTPSEIHHLWIISFADGAAA
jgi:hypothetical protein